MKLKKLITVNLIFIMILFGGFYVRENVNAQETFSMRLANVAPEGDSRHMAATRFADLVEEKTEGRVTIDVYSGGQLGDWQETLEGLGLGINEIVLESIGTLQSYTDYANIDAVPYLYEDYNHYEKVWNSEIGDRILKEAGEDGGFTLVGPMYRGVRVTTSKVKFTTPEEVKGLDIRSPGIEVYMKTWEELGANPTPIAATEIFTSLQQGMVDAQENPIIFSYNYALYDVTDYLIRTDHVFSTDVFVFNREYFNDLPEDVQRAIEEAADEASRWRNDYVLEQEKEFIEKFKEEGIEIVEVNTDDFIDKFDGFVEEHFPYLEELTNEIREFNE